MPDGLRRQWPTTIDVKWIGGGTDRFLPPSSPIEMHTAFTSKFVRTVAPIWEAAGRPMCPAMQDCNVEWRSAAEKGHLSIKVDTAHVSPPAKARARATWAENRPFKLLVRFRFFAEELLPLYAWMKRGRRYLGGSYLPLRTAVSGHTRFAFRNTTA